MGYDIIKNITLKDDDILSLQEVIFNATDNFDISDIDVYGLWKKLPRDIQLEILKYGADESITKEKVYNWIKNNKEIKDGNTRY